MTYECLRFLVLIQIIRSNFADESLSVFINLKIY